MRHDKEIRPEDYSSIVKRYTPGSKIFRDTLRAFWVGGFICVLGQLISTGLNTFANIPKDEASALASITLVFAAAFLTALGIFDKIGRYAGGGTIVPITGFSNSIVSAAMEYRSEGLVMGVGARMFQIAGPVLVYGIGSSVFAGVIFYIINLIWGV